MDLLTPFITFLVGCIIGAWVNHIGASKAIAELEAELAALKAKL